jgi:hypothetical protein
MKSAIQSPRNILIYPTEGRAVTEKASHYTDRTMATKLAQLGRVQVVRPLLHLRKAAIEGSANLVPPLNPEEYSGHVDSCKPEFPGWFAHDGNKSIPPMIATMW